MTNINKAMIQLPRGAEPPLIFHTHYIKDGLNKTKVYDWEYTIIKGVSEGDWSGVDFAEVSFPEDFDFSKVDMHVACKSIGQQEAIK